MKSLQGINPSGYRVKLYPSGDFSIGKLSDRKKDKGDDPLGGLQVPDEHDFGKVATFVGRQVETVPDAETLFKLSEQFYKDGHEEKGKRFLDGCLRAADAEVDDPSALGLSVTSKYHKKTLRRGQNGITPTGKRLVRSCVAVLEDKYESGTVQFGTATIPPLAPVDLATICENWGQITRKFFQEISRMLTRKGLATDFVYVTEIQESRYKAWGQLYPHLHWVCVAREHRFEDWRVRPEEIREIWSRMLSNALGKDISCESATRVEKPRGSLRKEIGKYLSKGGKILKRIVSDGKGHLLPNAWYGANKDLKLEVKRAIKLLTGDDALDFIDNLEALQRNGMLKFRKVMVEFPCPRTHRILSVCIGFVGFIIERSVQIALAA